jgi:hypothetical protein
MPAIGRIVCDSNPAKDDGLLRAIKFCSTTSFGGKLKPSIPCHKILWHVKDPYSMKKILCRWHSRTFLVRCLCWLLQRALVGGLGMIISQMRKHNRSVMVTVCGMPCAIPPLNSNSNVRDQILHPAGKIILLYVLIFTFLRQMGSQKILNCIAVSVSWILCVVNFLVNAILIC